MKRPAEENSGLWKDFVSEQYGFRVMFPSFSREVSNQKIEKFVNFESWTPHAQYGLLVRDLLVTLNNSQLETMFESIVKDTEDESSKLVGARDVVLNGSLGKELIYEESGRMVFGRIFVMESKLFMLTVSVAKRDYTKDFDRWVYKFFDSFGVRTNTKFEA